MVEITEVEFISDIIPSPYFEILLVAATGIIAYLVWLIDRKNKPKSI